jgi:ribosomal protein L31E
MSTLESRLEKAKKAVEVAKEKYEKSKPTEAEFEKLGYGHMNEKNIEHWVQMNRASKKYREKRAEPAIKALKALETAQSKLRFLGDKVKGGRTRRSKRGGNKTLRIL